MDKPLFEDLPNDWQMALQSFTESEEAKKLQTFVSDLSKAFKSGEVYPQRSQLFYAFELSPFKETKVVILGQDPYHGEGQAHGLAFSVPAGMKIPPSLRNIYKELEEDCSVKTPTHGDLSSWAKQGILLLNTVLTVEKSKAGSHQKKGWEAFTDEVIKVISRKRENVVFILWGSPAQKKQKLIDANKHHIIESVHPSPLSSYRGFFGSRPFSKTNLFLKSTQQKLIDWELPSKANHHNLEYL